MHIFSAGFFISGLISPDSLSHFILGGSASEGGDVKYLSTNRDSSLSLNSDVSKFCNSKDYLVMEGQVRMNNPSSESRNTKSFRSMETSSASKCWNTLLVDEPSGSPNLRVRAIVLVSSLDLIELKSNGLKSASKNPKNCSAAARECGDGGGFLSMPCESAHTAGKTVCSLISSWNSVYST